MDPAAAVWRAQLVYGVRVGAYEHGANRAGGRGGHGLRRANARHYLVLFPLSADGVVLCYFYRLSGDGRGLRWL